MPSSYQQAVLELLASRDDGEELSQAALDMITDRLHEHVRRKYPTLAGAAEDLAQDALVRFLRAVAAGRVERPARDAEPEGDEKPELYLLKTLERLCLDALRRSDRVRAATTRIEVTDDDDLASSVAGRVDAGALVRKAIAAALTAGDVTAVAILQSWKDAAHRYGKPTLAEVKEVSGRSVPTVRSVLEAFRRWSEDGKGDWRRL